MLIKNRSIELKMGHSRNKNLACVAGAKRGGVRGKGGGRKGKGKGAPALRAYVFA